eukprot:Phypoly_transcript_06816.p1 GENE.Phypoly_transcript_06816~~Phypoly_transcript_06816.p1  ORF type:complete len:490 (+),score=116.35 Phypoly_transcript_06816:209-1678(+)
MADVKDILNISTDKTPSKVESILVGKKKTPATQKRKKPEGVPREVFALQESALLGVGPAATAPPPQVPLFKEKRIAETQQKVSWVWKGFRNSARRDNAIFKHWVRTDDKTEDYKFARYNRKLKLQSYTNDEYTKHFQDPNWTREETYQLFDLCRRFDLRFVIVHDRFEPADINKPKSVEDLKERFYAISSKLLDLHKMPDEDLSANPLFNYTFNKKQEEERKQQSDKLFLRTAAQVLEEEGLIEQFRRLEGEMKKHNKAKKRIAHLMQYALAPNAAPATPTTPSFSASDYITPPPQPKSRKRKNHPDDDDEYEPDPADYEPTVTPRKNRSVDKSAKFQITPLTMGTKTAYRVDSALVELGLIRSDSPPVPAPSVTKAINELKQDLVILLDLQKYVSQKEYHLEVIKTHRDMLLKEMQEKNIPIPQLTNTDKNVLASSSTNVFGLAAAEEDSELLNLEAELFAPPPPSRSRTRDKEGKRSYKKHKVVVDG